MHNMYSPESLSITQRLASARPPTEASLELEESSDESDEDEESSDPAAAQNFDMVVYYLFRCYDTLSYATSLYSSWWTQTGTKNGEFYGRTKDRHGGVPPNPNFSSRARLPFT